KPANISGSNSGQPVVTPTPTSWSSAFQPVISVPPPEFNASGFRRVWYLPTPGEKRDRDIRSAFLLAQILLSAFEPAPLNPVTNEAGAYVGGLGCEEGLCVTHTPRAVTGQGGGPLYVPSSGMLEAEAAAEAQTWLSTELGNQGYTLQRVPNMATDG